MQRGPPRPPISIHYPPSASQKINCDPWADGNPPPFGHCENERVQDITVLYYLSSFGSYERACEHGSSLLPTPPLYLITGEYLSCRYLCAHIATNCYGSKRARVLSSGMRLDPVGPSNLHPKCALSALRPRVQAKIPASDIHDPFQKSMRL
jgi:hypothetical protein